MNVDTRVFRQTMPIRTGVAQPEDGPAIERFYRGLSADARYQRFFSPRPVFSADELARLAYPDIRRERAVLAWIDGIDSPIVVGDARCVDGEEPGICEIAVVVADDWRRVGIGRRLLGELATYAPEWGLSELYAHVTAGNAPMLALLKESGFRIELVAGDATMRIARCPVGPASGQAMDKVAATSPAPLFVTPG